MPEFGPNSGTCMLAMAFSKEDHVVVVGLDESQAVTTRAARSDVCTEKYADIKKDSAATCLSFDCDSFDIYLHQQPGKKRQGIALFMVMAMTTIMMAVVDSG